MKVLTKTVDLDEGKTVTVRELTVGEIRAWLAEAEAADVDGVDVVGSLLFEDMALADLSRMTDITAEEMDALPLSVINQIKGVAKALNADFFALRQRITDVALGVAKATNPA